MHLLLVAMGGALGAMARYSVYNVAAFWGHKPAWATFFINAVGAFLNRNSPYYHVAFTASEFNEDAKHLENCGLKRLETFKSEAFEMKRCAFFIGPDHHIIEIIEE